MNKKQYQKRNKNEVGNICRVGKNCLDTEDAGTGKHDHKYSTENNNKGPRKNKCLFFHNISCENLKIVT